MKLSEFPTIATFPAEDAPATQGANPFATDMLAALSVRPKTIAPKYFYDEAGSRLFDQICELPEYYPTRVETALLRERAAEIARHIGPQADLVEFGAGSMVKARLLLDAMQAPARYLAIDISGEHLTEAANRLRAQYPQLQVEPLAADYSHVLTLPVSPAGTRQRVGFFPGSTIGNYTPDEAVEFFRMAARVLRGGAFLVGADLIKEPAVLHAAYSDAQGVTAAFNLNLLARANRELGADFDLTQFAHSAFYNAALQRIEMHLMSRVRQQVRLCGQTFSFEEGETLHTENSYKFTIDGLRGLAIKAGFTPGPVWTDANQLFSVHWLVAPR